MLLEERATVAEESSLDNVTRKPYCESNNQIISMQRLVSKCYFLPISGINKTKHCVIYSTFYLGSKVVPLEERTTVTEESSLDDVTRLFTLITVSA